MKSLTLAVPKGRILKELLPLFEKAKIIPEKDFLNSASRKLLFKTNLKGLNLIKVRSFDVATFVAIGAAQIGVAGDDVIEEFNYEKHLPDLKKDTQQTIDIERFRWFAQDYLGFVDDNNLVVDIRYSNIPNQVKPMWGLAINLELEPTKHAAWWTNRTADQNQLNIFKEMLTGSSCNGDKK